MPAPNDSTEFAARVVDSVAAALTPMSDAQRALDMRAYMKDVAPYLGISTPDRRKVLRPLFRTLSPTEAQLGAAARQLFSRDEREFHYAACDLLTRFNAVPAAGFLHDHVEYLLTTTPWWDTVDSLGSAIVTPLVHRNPPLVDTMWQWLRGPDMWLTRAALQHQRGLREQTDVACLVAMCDERATDKEFFVAKAVGWALRDLAHIDTAAALEFYRAHDGRAGRPTLSAVARREARRGLEAVGQNVT